jgi:hypothetical protein
MPIPRSSQKRLPRLISARADSRCCAPREPQLIVLVRGARPANSYGEETENDTIKGKGEFVGDFESREKAASAYDKIIGDYDRNPNSTRRYQGDVRALFSDNRNTLDASQTRFMAAVLDAQRSSSFVGFLYRCTALVPWLFIGASPLPRRHTRLLVWRLIVDLRFASHSTANAVSSAMN